MRLTGTFVIVCGALLLSVACGTEEDRTGLAISAISSDLVETNDVASIRFDVERVECTGEEGVAFEAALDTLEAPLAGFTLPGGIPGLVDNPFVEQSAHAFADEFFVLPVGCYDVTTTPLTESGEPSSECGVGRYLNAEVFDGETTEITVISQCDGLDTGGLDLLAALNHPPVLIDLTFDPSKFLFDCSGTVVCATASDIDGDPMVFEWEQIAGGELLSEFVVVSNADINGDGVLEEVVTECVHLATAHVDDYEVELRVYDMISQLGVLVKIEDLLAAHGNTDGSHDSLSFPIYGGVDCIQSISAQSEDTPLDIPDGDAAGITSEIYIDTIGPIYALSASVDITHPYVNDIVIELESPSGTVVTLRSHSGGSSDDIHETYDVTALNGEMATGTWKLHVYDMVNSDVGTLDGWALDIDVVLPQPFQFASTDTPIDIPDLVIEVLSGIVVPSSGLVATLEVEVNIEHTWIGDLKVELQSPGGTVVLLHDQEGGGDDDIHKTYAVPEVELENPNCTWWLRVTDMLSGDQGTLEDWTLDFTLYQLQ